MSEDRYGRIRDYHSMCIAYKTPEQINEINKHLIISPENINADNNDININKMQYPKRLKDIDNDIFQLKNINFEKNKKTKKKKLKILVDPSFCLHQIDEMYLYYNDIGNIFVPKPYMIEKQTTITPEMRSILIDWLIDVCQIFEVDESDIWLCINIIDRYLEKNDILKSKFQLLGITSFFIVTKIEDVYPPDLQNLVYVCNNAYSKTEILKMELELIKEINYQLMVPTAYHFIIRYLNFFHANETTRYLTFYYAERNLQEYDTIKYEYNIFAAACIYSSLLQQSMHLSCMMSHNKLIWPFSFQEFTGLQESDVRKVAKEIINNVSNTIISSKNGTLLSIKKKFSSDKYLNVSNFDLPFFI
jgi:cyclin B